MTKIQRVKKVCKWLIFIDYAENDADLAKKLGYTKSSFSQIMNEKVPLSDKFVSALVNTNININIVWINEEKDEMLRNRDTIAKPLQSHCDELLKPLQDQLNDKIEIITYQKKEIAMLRKQLQDCEDEKKRMQAIE